MKNKMGTVLIASSILLLVCIFSMSYKMMGLGFLQYVVVLSVATASIIKKKVSVSDLANHLHGETMRACI